MNKLIAITKIGLISCLLAGALTGCGLLGNNSCCDRPCCKQADCAQGTNGRKTSGVNTSMTIGVGTDGLSLGSESNIGSHGVSGAVSTH